MIEKFEMVKIFLASQFVAPWRVMSLPNLHPLKVFEKYHASRGTTNLWYGGHRLDEPTELPDRFVVKIIGRDGNMEVLGIDKERNVARNIDWMHLKCEEWPGLGELGIFFLGWPGLIVCSPIIFVMTIFNGLLRRITGLNMDAWAVYFKLRGQLDKKERGLVRAALENELNGVAKLAEGHDHDEFHALMSDRIRAKYDELSDEDKKRFADIWEDVKKIIL